MSVAEVLQGETPVIQIFQRLGDLRRFGVLFGQEPPVAYR